MMPAPPDSASASLADWAELWCVINADGRAPKSELNRALTEASFGDSAIDDLWLELTRRETLLGTEYPYNAGRGLLQRAPWRRGHLTYIALLLLASGMTYDVARLTGWSEEAKLFEHIAARALNQYVSGEAHRIGWPREGEVPAGFAEMLQFLKDELNEEGPQGNVMNLFPEAKDGGVDVVAWRPFRDRRRGQLILLGQCAIGRNWNNKLNDFSMERWRRYLGSLVPPVRAFLTPYAGVGSSQWDGVALEAGIFMDRMRISEMAGTLPAGPLRRRTAKWCRERVETVRAALQKDGWQT